MGIRTRRAHRHATTHFVGFAIAGIFGFLSLLGIALAVSLGGVVSSWLENLPDYQSADAYLVAEPTTLYAADGSVIVDFYLQKRRSVEMSEISDWIKKGTVDTEDIRFYQHNGVDPIGILRAVSTQLAGGSEGASTITQQLVRNTILSDEQFDKTLRRKVREAYLAIQLEKRFDKSQILNMYLNTIYYGNGVYGIEAASIHYFNKHASELSLAEAALLVGIPNSPTNYDPVAHPEAAKARRNVVLRRMLSAGDITQEQFDEADASPIELNPGSIANSSSRYPYFSDYVKSLLLEDFDADTVFQGGLKVYTTLDPTYQDAADAAVERRLDEISIDDDVNLAVVSVDNSNGHILAIVGGRDYNTNQYNMATQGARQVGSTFKVFTLTEAINEGMNPNIILNTNGPMQITKTWPIGNAGGRNYGYQTLRQSTIWSLNVPYAQVALTIGNDKIRDMAYTLGIKTKLNASPPSFTLGVSSLSPLEMASAYSTLASGGIHHDPIAITKIEDRNGKVLYEHNDEGERVISDTLAAEVTDVLEDVQRYGYNGNVYNLSTFNQPAASKTGTTNDSADLWYIAYTPQVTSALWMGYSKGMIPVYVNGQGGTPAAIGPIWAYYMNTVLKGVPREEFPKASSTISYKPNSSWSFIGTPASVNSGSSTSSNSEEQKESSTSTQETTTTENRTETSTSTTTTTEGGGGNGTGGSGGTGGGNNNATTNNGGTAANGGGSSSSSSQNGNTTTTTTGNRTTVVRVQ